MPEDPVKKLLDAEKRRKKYLEAIRLAAERLRKERVQGKAGGKAGSPEKSQT